MKVCFEYEFDSQTMLTGVLNILLLVSARIDHHCSSGFFVADQIRRMRQTFLFELFKDHEYRLVIPTGV
jgi:hypothetical protein